MPGFDGTGPAGMGPMSGRRRGFCIVPLDRGPGIYGIHSSKTNAAKAYMPSGSSHNPPARHPARKTGSPVYLGRVAGFTPIRTGGSTPYRKGSIRGRSGRSKY